MTRILLVLFLLAPLGCDGQKGSVPGKQNGAAANPVVGAWILQPEAVHEMILRQTRNDMISEGMDAKKLNEKQMAAVRSSAAGCTRTIVLSADGTFTSDLERNVPGEQFSEKATGRWKAFEGKVVLTIERIGDEAQDRPEQEELLRKDGGLVVDYYDNLLPMIRRKNR